MFHVFETDAMTCCIVCFVLILKLVMMNRKLTATSCTMMILKEIFLRFCSNEAPPV